MDLDPQSLLFLEGRYVEYLRVRHYTEQTLYNRAKYLRYFRTFCQGLNITQAREVTRAVTLSYQSHLFHHKKRDGRPMTVGTQKAMLSAVKGFFSWLTKESHVLYNPASDLEMPRREYRLPKTVLNAGEVETILQVPDVAEPTGLRDRAILETLYSTGIRRAELCGLNLEHIDCDRGLLQIVQGKGKKDRFVPIGERAMQWIEKYLSEGRPALCPAASERALFLNANGERITPGRLGSHVHELVAKAQLPSGKRGSCHLFRHTYATLMLEGGCDVRHLQEMLGHSKLETTANYTKVSVNHLKQAHAKYHPANNAR